MPISLSKLPNATRQHLYRLVLDEKYRKKSSHEAYEFKPTTDGGLGMAYKAAEKVSLVKFGYDATLPAGIASMQHGDPAPGAYRLARYIRQAARHGADEHSWWKLEHLGVNNLYKFHRLELPLCHRCNGRVEYPCAHCQGRGRIVDKNFVSPCNACRQLGYLRCPCERSKDFFLYNGMSLETDPARWV